MRRNQRSELEELATLLETPEGFGALAKAAVVMRRTEEVKVLLAKMTSEETDSGIRKAILDNMLVGGKDKKFKPMPVKELEVLKEAEKVKGLDEKKLGQLARLFVVGTGEEAVYLVTEEHKQQFREGEKQYQRICLGCHQIHGNGQQYLAPPLVGSEWVLGSTERLIALVMDGVMGPIEVLGKTYTMPEIQPLMPGLRLNPEFTDENLAAVMTYVRNAWENGAPPVSVEEVKRYREKVAPRGPWTPEELMSLK